MPRLGQITGDATAAILAAGSFVELGPYDYNISQTLILNSRMGIEGCGSGLTRLIQTANVPIVTLADNALGSKLFGVMCIRTSPQTVGIHGVVTGNGTEDCYIDDVESDGHDVGFALGPTDFGRLRDLTARRNLSHGLWAQNTVGVLALQWDADDCLFEFNGSCGARFSAVVPGYCTLGSWSRPTTFANGYRGILCESTVAGASLNDCRFSQVTFSNDNGHEIEFANTNGEHNMVHGGLVEVAGIGVAGILPASKTGCGVVLSGANVETSISLLSVRGHSDSGIAVVGSAQRVNLIGNMVSGNGQWGMVGGATNIIESGNQVWSNKVGQVTLTGNVQNTNILS